MKERHKKNKENLEEQTKENDNTKARKVQKNLKENAT